MTEHEDEHEDAGEERTLEPRPVEGDAVPRAEQRPRRRFRAAKDDELDPQSFMVANDRAAVRTEFRGGSISSTGGDAHFIGGAIRRLADTLRQSADVFRQGPTQVVSYVLLRRVEFGNSVVIDLEISPTEAVQLGVDGGRHSPTIEASRALAQLLGSDAEDLIPRALELGPDGVASYKRFLDLLSAEDVTVEWQTPDATEVVVVSGIDARHDFAILDREGERQTGIVEVPGKLTMADSALLQFALTLPPTLTRPPLLKGKQRVRGAYTEEVGERLHAQNLWDSDVMATIQVTYDVPGTTPTPRDPAYVLVGAEPLFDRGGRLF